MAKKFSEKFKAEALRLLGTGLSVAATQAQLAKKFKGVHVGDGTLRGWIRVAAVPRKRAPALDVEYVPESEPLPPAPPNTSTPAVEPEDDAAGDLDVYAQTRRQLITAQRRAEEASRDGNHTAAQRFSKQAVESLLLLARLDKDRKVDTDAVSIPRAEFDQADRTARDILARLRADIARTGGLVCSNCGRELRIALAKGEKPE